MKEEPATTDDEDSDVPLSKRRKVSKGRRTTRGKTDKADFDKRNSPEKKGTKPARHKGKENAEEVLTFFAQLTWQDNRKRKRGVKEGPKKKVKQQAHSDDESRSEARAANGTDADDEDEEFRWWEEGVNDGETKWTILHHNGPYFPPAYEPHGVPMKYDGDRRRLLLCAFTVIGKTVSLGPHGEEVASFYAALIGTDWAENPTFQENFFRDFRNVLVNENSKMSFISKFEKCDFSLIADYLQKKKEERKNMTKEEKQKRVLPEQVTINISADAKVPEAPQGHSWEKVIHDNTVTWLAMWKENVNESIKYVFLAATSSLKGQSDLRKFEKARGLKKYVEKIRSDYTKELKDKVMAVRQRATAMYLIDRFALRAGNEKGEDEADTVGCCSLRFEHVSLEPPNIVIFDFLGKDSIRYYNRVEVDVQVFKNLQIFKKEPKKDGDLLFDRLSVSLVWAILTLQTTILNKHLSTYMEGLTAKVFRTYNASYTFQEELKKTPVEGQFRRPIRTKWNAFKIKYAHMVKFLTLKLRGLKYEKQKIRKEILNGDPELSKKEPALLEEESDLDDEFISRYELEVIAKEKEKEAKLLAKENEKRKENGQGPLESLPPKKKSVPSSTDKLLKKFHDLENRIKATRLQMIDKVLSYKACY
ncbi:DNA topoisomerase 1 [Phlyctochytrium bullatum]|nr:DNA topoisomerase 1 [Phlyctochytrium bullatum]